LETLEIGEKDMEGHRLMLKLSKPRKPRKQELREWAVFEDGPMPLLWHEKPEELRRLFRYCKRDVEGEVALSDYLGDLSPYELLVWQMDQEINERGFWCDVDMARKALRLTNDAIEAHNEELADLTGLGGIRASKRKDVQRFLGEELGVELPNMKAETVEEYLKTEGIDETAARILEVCKSANRTSTKKYVAM